LIAVDVQEKQPQRALTEVQTRIAASPNNSGFYFLMSELYVKLNQLDKAEEAAQKSVDLNANNVDAILLLTQLQVRHGSPDKAIANYQQAIQKNPRDVRLYIAQGSLEETRGNWQNAEKLYQQALQAQPDYPVAANDLAYLMLEHGGDKDVALTLAQTARRGLPDIPNTADTLAWAYYNKGVYESAIDLLQEAVKASPNNATYRYHLGMSYQKNNDFPHAKEQFERALQLNPPASLADEIHKALAQGNGG